ncbi:hypothetical protein WN48_09113 [Eufriesea mexicana]|uniref:Uncharacterized protein n=1 Tax=Eufriesea mexicana TaxID=516756 RepID=A0A310SJM2_9HYME|nr:hypothetical protein WN48_09113 [Eufriesea mexicana]
MRKFEWKPGSVTRLLKTRNSFLRAQFSRENPWQRPKLSNDRRRFHGKLRSAMDEDRAIRNDPQGSKPVPGLRVRLRGKSQVVQGLVIDYPKHGPPFHGDDFGEHLGHSERPRCLDQDLGPTAILARTNGDPGGRSQYYTRKQEEALTKDLSTSEQNDPRQPEFPNPIQATINTSSVHPPLSSTPSVSFISPEEALHLGGQIFPPRDTPEKTGQGWP